MPNLFEQIEDIEFPEVPITFTADGLTKLFGGFAITFTVCVIMFFVIKNRLG